MERYAKSAGRLLTRFRPDPITSLPSNRNGLVASVEQALARRARMQMLQQRLVRGGAVAAAAAVLLASGLTLWRFVPGVGGHAGSVAQISQADSSPNRAGKALKVLASTPAGDSSASLDGAVILGPGTSPRPLIHGMALEPGIRLVAPPTSEVRIGTADGTQLTLEQGGELTVVEQSNVQRYLLQRGAVRARVAKLQPGERFIIATGDGEIEVHGTVFRVSTVAGTPNCRGGAKTRVSVFEGVVSVRSGGSEALVPAGGQWPEDCGAGPTEVNAAARASVDTSENHTRHHRRVRRNKHGHATRTSRGMALVTTRSGDGSVAKAAAMNGSTAPGLAPAPAPAGPPVESSTLLAQNDLFAAAVRAKRQRRESESAELFSRLLDTYPNGPLTEGAMVQRMKVLAAVDNLAAARAANEYLARFPGGFARAAAHRIAGAAP